MKPTLPREVWVCINSDGDRHTELTSVHANEYRESCVREAVRCGAPWPTDIARYVREDRHCALCGGNVGDDIHARECQGRDAEREKIVAELIQMATALVYARSGEKADGAYNGVKNCIKALEAYEAAEKAREEEGR